MHPLPHRHHRYVNHGLAQLTGGHPTEVLAWMGAMQAQDYASAKWALGVRNPALSDAAVETAIVEHRLVRTWALRSTLHLMSAADVRWILALIGPVMLTRMAAMYRRHNLDDVEFAKIVPVIRAALRGNTPLLREELFAALGAEGIDTAGLRGNCILYRAALSACICPASLRGKQLTYALLDDWVPAVPGQELPGRDAALTELALRYFRSHGPASLRDFAWWSGLGIADAKRGLAQAKAALHEVHIGGQICWQSSMHSVAEPSFEQGSPIARLLPAYDEYFLGYEDRTAALDAIHFKQVMTNNGIFRPTVLINGEIVGTWTRVAKTRSLSIKPELLRPLSPEETHALAQAAQHYAQFLGLHSAVLAI